MKTIFAMIAILSLNAWAEQTWPNLDEKQTAAMRKKLDSKAYIVFKERAENISHQICFLSEASMSPEDTKMRWTKECRTKLETCFKKWQPIIGADPWVNPDNKKESWCTAEFIKGRDTENGTQNDNGYDECRDKMYVLVLKLLMDEPSYEKSIPDKEFCKPTKQQEANSSGRRNN